MPKCKYEWVEISTGRSRRLCTDTSLEHLKEAHPDKVEAYHNVIVKDPNKHDEARHYKLYGEEKMAVNEDLKSDLAAKEWPGYTSSGDRQGPRPFSTMRERRDYCRRYGFEET